jgi:hypothetical protein
VLRKLKRVTSKVLYKFIKNTQAGKSSMTVFIFSKEGDILKKQYNLKIKKRKDKPKLTVHPDGEIIAER